MVSALNELGIIDEKKKIHFLCIELMASNLD